MSDQNKDQTTTTSGAGTVTAYVIAFNEEEKIRETLATLQWADDILLVDSHSTDRTAEIARSMGARVVQVEFNGFGDLRNKAIEACKGNWIFSLDSDERCTAAVRDEVLQIVRSPSAAHELYFVPRRNYFMGRWIRHSGWYPNYRQPQLFRRGAMRYDTLPVHEGFVSLSNRPAGYLKNAIWQYPFKGVGEVLRKADRYSSLGALKLLDRRITPASALLHGIWSFLRHYVFKGGALDGWAGLVIAIGNFEGTFYRHLKAYEIQHKDVLAPPRAEPVGREDIRE
jgi:glycosyltransferase involved in cell wall biosynthesis